MTLSEIALKILSENSGKVMTIENIAENAIRRFSEYVTDEKDILKNKFSSAISADIRRKGSRSQFKRLKNKRGGYQSGKYALKRVKEVPLPPPKMPIVSTGYTGKAGEHAVLSELLFFGYNASIMTVDDGVDIVASKDNNYFHLQVKTSSANMMNDEYAFSVNYDKFEEKFASTTFYIFVMRRTDNSRYFNDYLILSSQEVKTLIGRRVLTEGEKLSFRIKIERPLKYVLNRKDDISYAINKFDKIR